MSRLRSRLRQPAAHQPEGYCEAQQVDREREENLHARVRGGEVQDDIEDK
jgi:hypothetical protein